MIDCILQPFWRWWQVQEAGGQLQFPFLMDRNTEPPTQMYESDAIVKYLYQNYGGGAEPPKVSPAPSFPPTDHPREGQIYEV